MTCSELSFTVASVFTASGRRLLGATTFVRLCRGYANAVGMDAVLGCCHVPATRIDAKGNEKIRNGHSELSTNF